MTVLPVLLEKNKCIGLCVTHISLQEHLIAFTGKYTTGGLSFCQAKPSSPN